MKVCSVLISVSTPLPETLPAEGKRSNTNGNNNDNDDLKVPGRIP